MDIYNISNLKIKSVIKVINKVTESQLIQYDNFLNLFQLIYVISGKAKVVFDNTAIVNEPGNIVFLPQGHFANYYAKILEEEECIAVFFQADFPTENSLLSQNFIKNTKFPVLFEKLYQIWQRKEPGFYNQCMSVFYSILSEMELSSSKYLPNNKSNKLNKAIEYIHAHYTDSQFQYELLPSLCGISYTYFKKLFMERFCMTPSEYIKNLKIQLACELLLSNQFSVSQVAETCGFQDLCYFSKFFKTNVGISPSKYCIMQSHTGEKL